MVKKKSSYFCSECGYESQGWLGKCPICDTWNSMVESTKVTGSKSAQSSGKAGIQQGWLQDQLNNTGDGTAENENNVLTLAEVEFYKEPRLLSGIDEFDRVLGGGFVPGSLVLVGGDPGIGKSTLLLQICAQVKTAGIVLYVCGEESPEQIKLRANRLNIHSSNLRLLPEISFQKITEAIIKYRPSLVIIDSIQTIFSDETPSTPGSVTQIRDCTAGFLRIAKKLNITMVLIGHVTKDGSLAGPRILEHMVDTVIYFEQNNHSELRFIRGVKNRFGATNEIGIFEMQTKGLVAIPNPSEIMLAGRPLNTPGSVLTATSEGSRPLLIELQALITPTNYGLPQRMAPNLDRNRINMLLAVSNKFLQTVFDSSDVYINVVSGIKVNDTGTDLAIIAAMISSKRNQPLPENTLIIGEVGLTGELRPSTNIVSKISESNRLGIKQVILPGSNRQACRQNLRHKWNIDLIFVDNLSQAIDIIFK